MEAVPPSLPSLAPSSELTAPVAPSVGVPSHRMEGWLPSLSSSLELAAAVAPSVRGPSPRTYARPRPPDDETSPSSEAPTLWPSASPPPPAISPASAAEGLVPASGGSFSPPAAGPPAKRRRIWGDSLFLDGLEERPGGACERTGAAQPWPWEARAPPVSQHAAGHRADVLKFLHAPPGPRIFLAIASARRSAAERLEEAISPEKLAQACQRWRLTMQDLESLVLPSWNFNCAFPDRRTFFEHVEVGREGGGDQPSIRRSGDASSSSSPASPGPADEDDALDFASPEVASSALPRLGTMIGVEFVSDDGLTCYSARWAELLEGTVLARLMTDARPTEVGGGTDPSWSQDVLSCLRCIVWRPELHWIFPRRCRDRLVFLIWVGRAMRLEPAWTMRVLPFLSAEAS